ncbi:PREDICTED: riboflavin biosynthesis protein PYRD, chloroplastic-like isoform X2 [Lupinus angustifolius]|uniref:riboflavin biosynthesis protein PYRD, chloroplastic-like isoform X1 n=1 Tax=Lupinus angustifolius TaxID=3871 RepID=UPI00092FB911|nr:PREDICTED: riboflavin biosynthesis protein PYRD, chloroplastic-like isoform X1 [Lupinus angustifolius]XP_019456505.1 PREDICTED: riboflavin biosynthesis protein PYRD, chloroplastic-like isoform X2 [Lupinus angustifolius]
MKAQPFSLSLPCYSFLPLPRFSSYATPPNFASFPPIHDPSKNLTYGFYKSLIWVHRTTGWKNSCGGGSLIVKCGSHEENDDGFYIRRCVEVARKGIGNTSPNPMVGCVIVKDGKIVGEGFHPKAGQPHAEVFALRDAGDMAENATAYVSLEPCNHFGRTPPCTEALVKAKVKKVVVGMVDPNPIVASKGVDRLRSAGIEVVVGVEEDLCKRLNEAYIHRMLTGRPFLTLRYSLSVNGNFLDLLGDGVTDHNGYYSLLLQEYDAVVLSSSLFSEKLSIPASQEPGANQPSLIIIHKNHSSSSQIPLVINEATGKVILFTDDITATASETTQRGIETVAVDLINLDVILDYCNRQGLCSVLLDMRGDFSEFEDLVKEGIQKRYINKFVTEILPIWNGFAETDPLMPLKSIEQGIKVVNLQTKASNQSIVFEGYLKF